MKDYKQRVIDRIAQLKVDKIRTLGRQDYEDGRVLAPVHVSPRLQLYYHYTYNTLLKELEDILK